MNFVKKLTRWYFSQGALPYWGVLLLDCLIIAASAYVGYYFDLGGMGFTLNFWQITEVNVMFLFLYLPFFKLFHTYSGILRYSSLIDLERVGGAVLLGSILSFVAGHCFIAAGCPHYMFHSVKGTAVVLILSVMLMWLERMAVRAVYDAIRPGQVIPAAIYGTRTGGISLAHSIMSSHDKKFSLRCFITEAKDLSDAYLLGKPVFENNPDIVDDLKEEKVKALLVSPLLSDRFRNNIEMQDAITQAGIKIYMMPDAEEYDGKSDISHTQLHEVEIEDLLPRDEIKVDMDAIGAMLTGKRILITGAAGSIGSEMVRQVSPYKPSELILVDQAETPMHDIRRLMARQFPDIPCETIVVSITDKVQMQDIFSKHRPEYVFHAAAYKHVPMMEDNPAQAVRNNINGTRVIADLAVKYGTRKFVMISTDKAVNPTNVMGCSKRICEIYCQSLNQAIQNGTCPIEVESDDAHPASDKGCQFVTTRFGNVLGSNGSVIPIFREQIKKGGPVTVTHPDIIRYFMLIPEACKLVLEAGTMGKGGEIFVFDMGNPVRIVDLAKRMISLSGAKDIEIKFTGLRDGEKLYEEVLNDAEGTMPTVHPKIKVAKVREYDYETARSNEDELLQISYTQDDMAIVRKMKQIVPEYKSNVSKYQALD